MATKKVQKARRNPINNEAVAPDSYIMKIVDGKPVTVKEFLSLPQSRKIDKILLADVVLKTDNKGNTVYDKQGFKILATTLSKKGNGGKSRRIPEDDVLMTVKRFESTFSVDFYTHYYCLPYHDKGLFGESHLFDPRDKISKEDKIKIYAKLVKRKRNKGIGYNYPLEKFTPERIQELVKDLKDRAENEKKLIKEYEAKGIKYDKSGDTKEIEDKYKLQRTEISDLCTLIWLTSFGKIVPFTRNYIETGIVCIPKELYFCFYKILTGKTLENK